MCGIFGYFHKNGIELSDNRIKAMGEAIHHRGPDDHGTFKRNGVVIGNQRLSIIDIEGGHQPFISENGKITVVQNGEIYNHIELANDLKKAGYQFKTNSDTEVILRLYEVEGIDFVKKLNGMFSIAIYDENIQSLFLIRDRIGVKPLYVYQDNDQIIFGSEIKSILKAGINPDYDELAINHYLTFNFVPPPFTMFKGIKHVMPGHWHKVTKSGVTTKQWWDLTQESSFTENKSENQWIEDFNNILEDAVRIRLRADVPFGAFLSGGIDSSTVVAHMSHIMDNPVKTFSIGFHDARFDESIYAKQVAEMFNTDHVMEKVDANMISLWPLMIYHCDQPHGDVSFMPTYRVSQLAVEHVKMVLTGDGADELFAGYDKYKNFFNEEVLNDFNNETFQQKYHENISLFSDNEKCKMYTKDFMKKLGDPSSFEITKELFYKSKEMDRINQALYIDTMLLLPGNNLVKPDRMGMAVSLEARTPFLDYRMVEFSFGMPGHLKLRNAETKYIYKKAVTPLLGKELVYRKKQMFTVPIGEWFKKELAKFTEDKLLNGELVKRNIVNRDYIVNILDNHQKGRKNYTREIRALISLEYWFEQFMK